MDQKHAIGALGALAQETRLALFRLLVTCGPEGLPAGVIAERLGVLPSSLSFHLQQLVHAGLITQRRLSRQARAGASSLSPVVKASAGLQAGAHDARGC
jgi:predicted transcriptional regulator